MGGEQRGTQCNLQHRRFREQSCWLAGLAPRLIRKPNGVPLLTSCHVCAQNFKLTRKPQFQSLGEKASRPSLINCRNLTCVNSNLTNVFRRPSSHSEQHSE